SARDAVVGHIDGGAVDVGCHAFERLLLRPQILEVHAHHLAVLTEEIRAGRIDEIEADQAVGAGEREPAEHHPVHDAEHGGDTADAEGEDGDGHRAEPLLPEEDPEADAEILKEDVDAHRRCPTSSYERHRPMVPTSPMIGVETTSFARG